MESFVTTLVGDVTTTMSTFGSSFIETLLPVIWSILAVAAVIGFGWYLIRRFTGR